MKRLLLSLIIFFSFIADIKSQCSDVPVEETVRNGDFELGYLPGSKGPSHTYSAGSDLDFSSSLSYTGNWGGKNGGCIYGMANQYGVGRVENPACKFGGKQIVYGQYTGANKYKDHTTGTDKGYSMFIDFNQVSGSFKHVWKQTVNIYGAQKYYFSAWFAQYGGNQAKPTLKFKVESFDAGGNLIDTKTVGTAPVAPPAMQWQQFNGAYDSPPNAVTAVISIECKPTGQPSQDDFMIDDISFINSCQNINSQVAYTVDFNKDSINFCEIGGEYVATVLKNNGSPINSSGKTITWFEGANNPQTELTSWANNPAPTISDPGTYRVCVVDPANNGCTVGNTVVLKEDLNFNVSNYVLCNPAQVDVDLGLTVPNNAFKLDWSGPSGNVSNTSIYTVSKAGTHSVTATAINGFDGCFASDNFTVTSNLPESDTVDYCEGGGVTKKITVPDGQSYNWASNKNMNTILKTGNFYNYPIPNGSTGVIKLWVQNATSSPLGIGGSSSFGNYPDRVWNLSFKVTEYVQLKSFEVWGQSFVGGCGATGNSNYTFSITGGTSITHTQAVKCSGKTTININALLPPGNYVLKANKKLKSTNTTSNRNVGGGKVIINTTGKSMFGKLNFRSSNACAPIPMILNPISCCTAPVDDPKIDVSASTLKVCSPNNGEVVSVSGLTNGLDYQWQESIDGISWTDIAGETGDITGGITTLSNVSTEQWFRYVIAEDGNLGKACVKYSDSVKFVSNPLPVIDSIGLSPYQSSYCTGIAHELEAHVDPNSGYPVTYKWKDEGLGTDSVTDGITTIGTHNYKVVVDSKGCLDSMSIAITVDPVDSAKLDLNQGPFCVDDLTNPTITYDNGTTLGGVWNVLSVSNATINASTGELTMLDSGFVDVVYTTIGNCPDADTLRVEIKPGSETDFITQDTTFCKDDVSFRVRLTLSSTPGGTWSCKENSGAVDVSGLFDATGLSAGDYVVKYTVNGFSSACSDSDSVTVKISPLDTAAITQAPSVCSVDPTFQLLLDGVTTLGGKWTDSLGTNIYVDASGLFTPTGLLKGNYKVYYTTLGSCPYTDSAYVKVTDNIAYTMLSTRRDYCRNAPIDTIEVDVTGGAFWTTSGNGIVDVAKGYYDPSLATASGIDTIWYGKAGQCGDSVFIEINLLDIDLAQIDSVALSCNDWAPVQFTVDAASTIGGTWSGTGINASGLFDPSTASDTNMIYYTTPGVCPVLDSVTMFVSPRIDVSIDSLVLPFCGTASPLEATANLSGGTWEGSLTWNWNSSISNDSILSFDPNGQASGIDSVFYMISSACGDTATLIVGISSMETANIDSVALSCNDWAPIQFTVNAASTIGGTWSGAGINASGLFDPSIASDTNMIYYKTPGVCFVIDSVTMFVSPRIDVSIDSLVLPFCGTASPLEATANLSGGTWKGASTWNWNSSISNDSILSFDPNGQASGIDSIFYMISSACGDTATLIVGISSMETANIDSVALSCNDWAPIQFTVNAVSTIGGTWSGTGINASGLFDPSTASDTNMIYYTTPGVCFVVDSVTMFVSHRIDVSIDSLVLPFCGTAPPLKATANLSGGAWKGSGTWNWNSSISNDSILSFDPNGQASGIDSIFYMMSSACGDTATLIVGISPMEIADIDTNNAGPFCAADSPSQLLLNPLSTQGGIWSGGSWISNTGVFDPSLATISSNNKVIYTTQGVCYSADTFNVTVVGQIIVNVVDVPLVVCNDNSDIDLVTLLEPLTSSTNGAWQVSPKTPGLIVGSDFIVTLATPGNYTVKYALYGGTATCSDSDSVVISVLPVLDPSVKAGPSGNTCIADLTYQFINTGDLLGTWTISGSGVIDASTGLMDLTASGLGTFTITYGFGGNCKIDSSTTITIVKPDDPSIQAVQPLCEDGLIVDLVATGTQGGIWSGNGVDAATAKFNPSTAGDGNHIVTYSLTGDCPIDSSIIITVLPVMDPTIGNLTTGDVCISDGIYAFTNTGDPGGTWTISGLGVIDGSTGEVNLTSSGTESFIVTYTFGGVCSVNDQTKIDIKGPGNPAIQSTGPFCENLGLQQIPSIGTQGGTWSGIGIDPVSGVFNPATASVGTHNITYSLAGACPVSGTTDIIVEAVPVMNVQVNKASGCEPLTVTFLDNSTSKSLTSDWVFSDGSSSVLKDSVTMTFMKTGCYNVSLKNEFINGCVDSVTISNIVCVNPVPKANFDWGPKNTTVLDPFIDFNDKSINATAWTWNFGRGASPITSIDKNPFVTFSNQDSGVYNVCLIAENGICVDTICNDVTILDNFSVFVPNAFTPDGDGLNDVFFPNGKNHDNFEGASKYGFMIFNRWGELIWESNKPYQPWDATNQKTSNNVKQDVYVWKLNVWDNVDGNLKTYFGHVSVIK